MVESDPQFNRLKAKVLEPDPRQLWEKASVEYAVFFEGVRAYERKVHTKKLFRLWHMGDGRIPANWPRHLEWPIDEGFQKLWNDPIPDTYLDIVREKREFQVLTLCLAHGLNEEDAAVVICAWWEHHDISVDSVAFRLFHATIFQNALNFTEPARKNFEARELEKREAAKTERRANPAKTVNRIRGILSGGSATVDDITAELVDVNRAAVKKQCQRMAVTGEIEKLAAGEYRVVTEPRSTFEAEVTPPPNPPLVLSEEDRQILEAFQLEGEMDEREFLELKKEDFFPSLVERLKWNYDFLFSASEPNDSPDSYPLPGEVLQARLPF